MNCLTGKSIGDIHITVYQTDYNVPIFYLKADNKNLIPVLDYLEFSHSSLS